MLSRNGVLYSRSPIQSCHWCRRLMKTFNQANNKHHQIAKKSVLFPGLNQASLTDIFVKVGIRNVVKIRDVENSDGKTSAFATFSAPEDAENILKDTNGMFRMCFFHESAKNVSRKLSTKNSQNNSFHHLKTLSQMSFSDQIHRNFLSNGAASNRIEESYFVQEQLKELVSLVVSNKFSEDRGKLTPILQLFGSSVNGFGSESSDVDLAFHVAYSKGGSASLRRLQQLMVNENSLFKSTYLISGAKVPLITFEHRVLQVFGDITTTQNDHPFVQSKMSYFYSLFNPSIVPVFAIIKQILQKFKITASYKPGYLTTFQISVIYFCYLMHKKVIPPFNEVLSLFKNRDLGDILPCQMENFTAARIETEDLFYGFFEFIAEFDFESKKIDASTGTVRSKSFLDANKTSALIVANPLDVDHNVCRSASKSNLEDFQKVSKIIAERPCHSLDDYMNLPSLKTINNQESNNRGAAKLIDRVKNSFKLKF